MTALPMPMVIRTPKPLTNAQIVRLSARNPLFRMERNAQGELEVMTPVVWSGAQWESFVLVELTRWTRVHGGVATNSNAGFTLPDGAMLTPDAAWVSEACARSLDDKERNTFPHICPEFVIEVRSKSDRLAKLEAKMQSWIGNGAQLAWLIDPKRRAVTIYRPGREPERLQEPAEVHGEGPVAGFVLPIASMWGS